ncbi:ABC-F family ATP-binding cassette domain-containing protein [Enterococcus ratti]|uniref:ABC transporter ATP-binding protein n=1 Tax=Enterococcus ratti TaxID=150033 RepID=A0A1L8WLB3_9ENTE|nr:ABC-F family ATP-binding cassette domain-containing protein [Enterococcus ratti]OJG81816.1 ABC transporter ATP-binding protein [Enterococcus ratti]
MKELKVTDLNKTYGEKELFHQISFLIHEKDRIGLIGTNGTGKTSLLNVLAGVDSGEGDGQTFFYPSDYRIGYLSQTAEFSDELTVLQAVFQGDSSLIRTVKEYEEALMALAENSEEKSIQERYLKAEEQMNKEDAWSTDTNAKIVLQKLGISELNQSISTLSGGQKKRVSLAKVLIDEPDLLLLDEPTNHLDYEAIEWLENYLKQYRGALLMVTHDRYFLDRVTNRIFELSFGKLHEYKGNYEAYLLEKAERERVEIEQEEKRKRLYKQELAWMRAGVQARGTKQQARINRFEQLKENLYQVNHEEELELNIATKRLGKKVLEIKNGRYLIDEHLLFDRLNLLIQSRERLGITGKNGAGKSTLLNILAGRLSLDEGIFTVGETVRIAYYTQENEEMDPEKRLIAYLQEAAEEAQTTDGTSIGIAELLERFLFPRFMHGTLIKKLSGGEKRRLYLLKLLVQQPNVLLLDEPTNDLDIATLTILEEYFKNFPGAVITVSHDRYFLDKVAEKLLVFQGNAKQELYYGDMSSYLMKKKEVKQKEEHPPFEKEKSIPSIKKKLSYMEQKEWETIEDEIAELEEKMIVLQEKMTQQGDNFIRLQELQMEVSEVEKKLEEKMIRWEYLSEWAED